MSLAVALCDQQHALLLSDSITRDPQGVAAHGCPCQFRLAGGQVLQVVGDWLLYEFARGIAQLPPMAMLAIEQLIFAWAGEQSNDPSGGIVLCGPCSAGLRLWILSRYPGGEWRRSLGGWGCDPLDGPAVFAGGPHLLQLDAVDSYVAETRKRPWHEAKARARELFSQMYASNPDFIGGEIIEHVLRAGCS